VQELILLAGSFHMARELLDQAGLATENPNNDGCGRVSLVTLYKAKGPEFPHAFLPGGEEGSFPPAYGDLSKERRGASRSMR
jgi:DNA helicase-2/ATP-dependent DNA helicase PcrA